jgi:hypothetical protein
MYYVKSPKELGLKTDCQGIYIETTKPKIEAMITTGLLEFGVGDTREDAATSTIASRMKNHETSKNLDWQHYLLDSIPKPGYRDYALHRVISQTFAAQLEHPVTGRKNEMFQVAVADALIQEFVKTSDFENVRQWLVGEIRQCAEILNPNHAKASVVLRDIQLNVIAKIESSLKENGLATNFICELAPRIGKTILFLSVASRLREEYGHESMFVMAYGVGLSVKTSYSDEIRKYNDFSSMQFIDASEKGAAKEYSTAVKSGKMPIVFVSLNPDAEEKFSWINELGGTHIALLEETDFGTHTDDQIKKAEYILSNKLVTRFNSSGTNIGRVAKAFGKNAIDVVVSVPYAMVEQDSSIPNVVIRKFYNMLFDPKMNKLLECFDDDVLPNINKILKKAFAQKRFISTLFQDLLGYQPIYGLNLSDCAGEDIKHTMLFVNILKEEMEQLAKVIEDACPNHKVLILNGDYTNNKEAEGLTKEELVRMQNNYYGERTNLLVITNMMGTRSYSIPEIQATLFMKEGGDVNPYMQSYSRCLTPGGGKKYGHIFDFAFDQNKTRNTVMSVAIEAVALMKEAGITYPDAVRQVMNSVSIKDALAGSWVTADDIIKQFEDNNKLLEIANAQHRISIEDLTDEEIAIFGDIAKSAALGNKEKTGIDNDIKTGKTFKTLSGNKPGKKDVNPLKQVVEKAVRLINGSSTTVLALSNYQGESFLECIEGIAADTELSDEFCELYGIGPESILRLAGKLELPTLDMIVQMSKYNNTQKHIENSGLAILKDNPELWRKIFTNRRLRRFISSKKCKKILVVAGGHGSEIDVLVDMFGVEILSKIVYNDKYNFLCNQIARKYPTIIVCKGDFLELEFDMKFDVVVGNPPFSKNNKGKGGTSIYHEFAIKAMSMADIVAFVTPGSFLQEAKFSEMRERMDAVGISTIEVIPLDTFNNVNIVKPVYWVVGNGNYKVSDFFVTPESTLFNKIMSFPDRKSFTIRSGRGDVSTSDTPNLSKSPTTSHVYEYVDRVKKDGPVIVYCNDKINMNISSPMAVFAQRSGSKPKLFYVDGPSSYSQNVMSIQLETKNQFDNIKKLFSTELYQFILYMLSGGKITTKAGFPSAFTKGKIERIPALDLNVEWTDKLVYDHFGISEAEQQLIKDYIS